MITTMVKVKTPKARPPAARPGGPLFLTEWMEELGITDAMLAERLGKPVTTIWRWQNSRTRLNPLKQAQVAAALGIWPGLLWMHPAAKAMRMMRIVLENDQMREEPK